MTSHSNETGETLMAALVDSDADVRRHAVWALGKLKYAPSGPRLAALLVDSDVETRAAAAWSLGEIGDAASAQALLDCTTADAPEKLRAGALAALGKLKDARAVPLFVQGLDDPHASVRREAAWALRTNPDAGARDALIRLAREDADPGVRGNAIGALGASLDATLTSLFVQALDDPATVVRRNAAKAVGKLKAREAVVALVRQLDEADVGETAAWALGEIGDPSAFDAVSARLRSTNVALRRLVAAAVGKIGGARANETLLVALRDEDALVRTYAVRGLGAGKDVSAVAELRAAMSDADAQVRRMAAWALGEVERR